MNWIKVEVKSHLVKSDLQGERITTHFTWERGGGEPPGRIRVKCIYFTNFALFYLVCWRVSGSRADFRKNMTLFI